MNVTISFPRMTRGDFELCLGEFIREYRAFVQDKINEDWPVYSVTFMFAHLPGSSYSYSRRVQMIRAIEAFFSSFVARVVRYPNSSPDKSPILELSKRGVLDKG